MSSVQDIKKSYRRKTAATIILLIAVILLGFGCLFAGSSNMSISDCFAALAKKSNDINQRIIWNIK